MEDDVLHNYITMICYLSDIALNRGHDMIKVAPGNTKTTVFRHGGRLTLNCSRAQGQNRRQ